MATLTIINGAYATGKTTLARALLASIDGKRASMMDNHRLSIEAVQRDLDHSEIDNVIVVDHEGLLNSTMFPKHAVYQIHCSR